MNERITELIDQAQIDDIAYDKWGEAYNTNRLDPEKFTELLIKEAGAYLMRPEFVGRIDLDWSMVLNEHFGVEDGCQI